MTTAKELIQLRKRIEEKSIQIAKAYGINTPGTDGYTPHYCVNAEYVLHEVAHYVTLGRSIMSLPKKELSNKITDLMENVGEASGVELELDTLFVERLAGVLLQLWGYKTSSFLVQAALDATSLHRRAVLEGFRTRRSSAVLFTKAEALARWFRQVEV